MSTRTTYRCDVCGAETTAGNLAPAVMLGGLCVWSTGPATDRHMCKTCSDTLRDALALAIDTWVHERTIAKAGGAT